MSAVWREPTPSSDRPSLRPDLSTTRWRAGMGIVDKAEDTRLRRLIALKFSSRYPERAITKPGPVRTRGASRLGP